LPQHLNHKMSSIWKGPTYIKNTIDGKTTQSYKFTIDHSGNVPEYTVYVGSSSYQIANHITQQQWLVLLENFLAAFGRLFTRPLSPTAILGKLKCNVAVTEGDGLVEWFLEGITIENNQFIANWNYRCVPQIEVDEPAIECIDNEIITEDISGNATIMDLTELVGESKPTNVSYLHREKARQRVKQSRLNARLAYFRAKQDQKKYEERYGMYETDYPTSDESDAESSWTDDSSVSE
jgi:hypothetical protein